MNYRWFLLLLAIFSGNVLSFQSSIEIIEHFDDVKLVAFLKESDLADYPLWTPLSEEPPLSVNAAIRAVAENYRNNNEKLSSDAVSEIELREIAHRANHWHYLVKVKAGHSRNSMYQVYIVLMNGKVIPAIIETESFK